MPNIALIAHHNVGDFFDLLCATMVNRMKYVKDQMPPVQERSLLQSWLALPARTRLRISLGLCVIGAAGIAISDYLEKEMPPTPDNSTQR